MKKIRPKKLSTSFLLPIVLTVFVVLMLFTVIDAFSEKSRMIEELNKEADAMLSIASNAAEDAFWNYNDVSLKKIGETIAGYKEIASIKMTDEGEQIVFEYTKNTEPYNDQYLYSAFVRSVIKDDQKIGEIRLVFTTYYLNQETNAAVLQGFIRTIFINLIILLLIFFLSRNLSVSIDKIVEGVKRFSEGDRASRIKVKNSHEIKRLADRINTMFDDIVESQAKLTENYEALAKQEEALRISEERYRYAVEGSNDAIWDIDVINNHYFVSKRGLQIVGLPEHEKMDFDTWISLIHPQDQSHFEKYIHSFHINPANFGQIEFRVIGCNGEIRWIFSRGKGILNREGKLIRISGFYTDITERIKAEEAFNRLAYYDVLTGLPNRAMLFEYSNRIFDELKHTNENGALLYIDLDNFKTINDTKGHIIGDQLLVSIAHELIKTIDCDTIARIGGDELVVIDKNCNMMEASKLANEIMSVISKPWNIEGFEFNMTCSIGITMFPEDGTDINKLLMNADSAMFHAKEEGKDQFKFFDQSTNELMVKKIEMQYEIRQGILNREFVLFYQPQIDFKTGLISGVEALVRWQHPTKGLLAPFDFIGLAEESGLIISLGEQILITACQQSVAWEKAGYRDITMAVNFSAKQINKKDIVDAVSTIIDETGMRPELLDIEITESIAMENLENTLATINHLKERGIKFSLDDFGTGYSSLNYLHKLPINHLKIDKQFVQNIKDGNFEEVVVKATIEIAHSMDLIIIAEGIETKKQYEVLMDLKTDRAQGYYFSKPVPSAEVEKLMDQCFIPAKE